MIALAHSNGQEQLRRTIVWSGAGAAIAYVMVWLPFGRVWQELFKLLYFPFVVLLEHQSNSTVGMLLWLAWSQPILMVAVDVLGVLTGRAKFYERVGVCSYLGAVLYVATVVYGEELRAGWTAS